MKTIKTRPLHQPGLKWKVKVENKLPSKIIRWKWDDDYIPHVLFHPRSEKWNHKPSAQCMFCHFKYSNQFLAHSKLRSHLQNKHDIYQNMSSQYFKQQHEYVLCANGKIPSMYRS